MTLKEKTLAEMQREVDRYISQFKEGYFSPLSMLARMSEEVGEPGPRGKPYVWGEAEKAG